MANLVYLGTLYVHPVTLPIFCNILGINWQYKVKLFLFLCDNNSSEGMIAKTASPMRMKRLRLLSEMTRICLLTFSVTLIYLRLFLLTFSMFHVGG